MNRRSILTFLVGAIVLPCRLTSASPTESPSCKDCKKCGRFCKCECSKGCKCKTGCCKRSESPIIDPAFDPKHRPPHSKPPHSKPPHGRPQRGQPYHRLPTRRSDIQNYKIMMKKFDKNKDGKIKGKEKKSVYKYFLERNSLWSN